MKDTKKQRQDAPPVLNDEELRQSLEWQLTHWRGQEPAALKQFEEAKEKLRSIRKSIAYYEKELQRRLPSKEE